MNVQLTDIEIKYNPRTQFDGIDDLAKSINELGILQPLAVSKNGNGKFVLLDGQRRFMACQKLGLKEIPVIERNLDEQQQKEVPIATDYFKDKLKISEKAVGVANLINKEKKVTEQTLAKRYGWKVKDIKKLLILATLHQNVLKMIDDGQIDINRALDIAEVKREDIQIKIAQCMARHQHFELLEALEEIAFELPFDDIFTFEQAKQDNMVGIVINDIDGERVFTYDKKYYDTKNKEYEEREQKTYAIQQKKAQQRKEKEYEADQKKKAETKEQRTKERKTAKTKYDKTLNTFHEATKQFLTKKPKVLDIHILIEKFIHQICMDNCRLILKAFDVPFKTSEMQSADYKKEVSKIIKNMVKNEANLAKLIIYVDYLSNIYKTTMFDMDGVKKMIVKMNK